MIQNKQQIIKEENFRYDTEIRMGYIYVDKTKKYDHTVVLMRDRNYGMIYKDVDKDDNVIGYEITFLKCDIDNEKED